MRQVALMIAILLLTTAPTVGQDVVASGVQILPRRAELQIRELVDFANTTPSQLLGVGLVTGLSGTGDPLENSATAEPLMAAFRSQGAPVNDPTQLADSRGTALVWISAEIPSTGGREGDQFNVTITAANGAESLVGGELFVSPVRGHLPGDLVVAFASGSVVVHDPATPRRGTIRKGLTLVNDIITHEVGNVFDLKIKAQYGGHAATALVASTLNEAYYNSDEPGLPPIARAIDDRIVRVSVPEADQPFLTEFVKFVMDRRVRDPDLLNLPARVVVNRETGAIVATADVDISPVGVTHEALQFTVTQPPLIATPQAPITSQERWAEVASTASQSDMAKLTDLLAALRTLDVPVREQIDLLAMMHEMGALHAQFIEVP